jgi:hypothetical protein
MYIIYKEVQSLNVFDAHKFIYFKIYMTFKFWLQVVFFLNVFYKYIGNYYDMLFYKPVFTKIGSFFYF